MEVGLLALVPVLAAASVYIALGGHLPAHPSGVLARRAALRVRRVLRRLSSARIVGRALDVRLVRSLARELAAQEPLRALGLGEVEAVVVLGCALVASAVGAGVLFGSPVAGAAVVVAEVAGVSMRDVAARRRARHEVVAAMPGVYRTLSGALGSGQTLAQAVTYVGAHERGRAGTVFGRMSLRLRCGASTEEAVHALADELEVPGARLLATALVISHRTGSPLRDLLMRSARLAERQGEFERLLTVKTAQVRLSVRIVCLLPAVMLAILALVSPDFQRGLLTPAGIGCVVLAAALDALALFIIRRMVRGVL